MAARSVFATVADVVCCVYDNERCGVEVGAQKRQGEAAKEKRDSNIDSHVHRARLSPRNQHKPDALPK